MKCPKCKSKNVWAARVYWLGINTNEMINESPFDDGNMNASCGDCGWVGDESDLEG